MRRLLIILIAFFFVIAGVIVWAVVHFEDKVPRLPDDLRVLSQTPFAKVFARDEQLLGALGGRDYVSIELISPHFLAAIVAAEDKRFYSHRGVDHLAFLRAAGLNILRGGNAPGGSSITQQLAKNLFFSFKRSWERKIVEGLAAFAIEEKFPKQEILETYCNLIYFGRFAYGVERASFIYFRKHASQLTVEEAALLAGLPNAPSRLDPYNHLNDAKRRQMEILERMAEIGAIGKSEIEEIAARPISLAPRGTSNEEGSFALDYALETARREIGADLVNYGGVKIYSTIDLRLQRLAEETISAGVELLELNLRRRKGEKEGRLEGGLVAADISTGRILAIVGGRNYSESPFNRAVYSLRQPGSAIKPVIYLAALENLGITPESMVVDKPVSFRIDENQVWSPRNFDEEFRGEITLRYALAKSVNTIAAQLIDRVTPQKVVETAVRMGISSPLQPHLSLSLGATGATMIDMATAYATIARGGVEIDPQMLTRIEGDGGVVLAEFLSAGERRFDAEKVYDLIGMMKGVLDYGTGTVVRRRGFTGTAIGKTGTSSDYRDSWFVGATPVTSVAAWVGFDDNRQMFLADGKGVTGSSGAAPIWADFMVQATAGEPNRDFPPPSSLTKDIPERNQDFFESQKAKRATGR